MSCRRTATTLLAGAAVLLALPAGAAGPSGLSIKDLAGDANGLNGQAIGLPVPATSTAPASVGGADITSVDFATRFKQKDGKRVANGFTVTMTLAAAPQTGVNYLLTAEVSSTCDGTGTTMQLGYQDTGALTNSLAVCQAPAGETGTTIGSTKVDAAKRTITWTINKGFPVGAQINGVYAASTAFVLGVADDVTSEETFVYGR